MSTRGGDLASGEPHDRVIARASRGPRDCNPGRVTKRAKVVVVRALGCLLLISACGQPMPADAGLPAGYDEWAALCSKHYGDRISAKFCAGTAPPFIEELPDLERFLGLSYTRESLTGLSTGVGLRMVTPLNPRAIVMQDDGPEFEVLSFSRGEPLVELIASDSSAQTLRFFALQFHPRCEASPTGCNAADLLTPAIEFNWASYTLFDEDAVVNTPLDCNTCHQPDGPGTRKILRMQELLPGWTHWFNGDSHPEDLFLQAHQTDDPAMYAGLSTQELSQQLPDALENFLTDHGFQDQPNEFNSITIDSELRGSGASATWDGLYNNAVTGQAIPPPYFGATHVDPAKAAAWVDTYRRVIAGTSSGDQLPDTRTIVLDSALPAMSIRPKPGLDGRGILVHMCSQCHNSRLDQTLSRARFNVMTLDAMSREERDTAITRLQLADDDPLKMPPPRFRVLSPDELTLVIAELSK